MSVSEKATQNEIVHAIFESDEAFTSIQRFVEQLASQGVLEIFVSEAGLKKLRNRLIEEEALHDQYADLGKSGISIVTRYVYYYVQHLARTIYENGVGLQNDVAVWVKPLLEIDLEPTCCVNLFHTLGQYAIGMKTVFVQAIEFHFQKLEAEFAKSRTNVKGRKKHWEKLFALRGELSLLIEQAFPVGLKTEYKVKDWRNKKSDTFRRVNFEPVITTAPFKEVHRAFKENQDQLYATRRTSSEVETLVLDNFKTLILQEAFEQIEKDGRRKTGNVINEVICTLYNERPTCVNMRFVQAFYEFYRDDYAERQRELAKTTDPVISAHYCNGMWGNIVIPS